MRKLTILMIFFSSFAFFWTSAAEAQGSPMAVLRESVDSIILTLKNNQLDKDLRNNKIREIVYHRFDFEEMSRRTLATNWRSLSQKDREEFVDLFAKLLEASYVNKIDSYKDEYVIYKRELIRGRYAKVETHIVTQTATIPVTYILINKHSSWYVYDVVVENVSLVSTYRSSFNDIIKRDGIPKLLADIKQKIKKLNSAPNMPI